MNILQKTLIAIAAFGLAACDSSDDPAIVPELPVETFNLQVLHASPDSPAVNVLVDGSVAIPGADYKVGSGQVELEVGTYNIDVQGLLANDATTSVIGPVDLSFAADTIYTVVAVGNTADIEPVIFEQPRVAVTAGSARLAVFHAAPDAPEVDIYLTEPGALLGGLTPDITLAYKQDPAGPIEVPANDYEIQITVADQPDQIVFQSGPLTLADGNDLFIAAVENTGPAGKLISLVALNGTGSLEILDVAAPAVARIYHASADAPSVDIIANDNFEAPLVNDLFFADPAAVASVPADTYNIKVSALEGAVIAIDEDLTLEPGQVYDVLAIDELAAIRPLVLNDDPREVSTYGKVRIVHAAPQAQDVDIYVVPAGTVIDDAVNPTLANVSFADSTGYLPIDAGEYEVTVTGAGSKAAAIGPAPLSLMGNDVLTIVAIESEDGGAPFNVIITNDSRQLD